MFIFTLNLAHFVPRSDTPCSETYQGDLSVAINLLTDQTRSLLMGSGRPLVRVFY